MSLRMEDKENRLIPEPVPIDWEGHICKYAEKSYMYKYDLGDILSLCWSVLLLLYRVRCTESEREREREREVVASSL